MLSPIQMPFLSVIQNMVSPLLLVVLYQKTRNYINNLSGVKWRGIQQLNPNGILIIKKEVAQVSVMNVN